MLAKRIIGRTKREPSTWRIALFEIVIIIVGILLSVAITEAIAGRKEARQEQAYLQALTQDLTADLAYLEVDLKQRRKQVDACIVMLETLASEATGPVRGAVLATNLPTVSTTVSFNPNLATFRTLESTGRLELIDDEAIVRSLIQLYSRPYDLLEQNNNDVNQYRNNFLLPFIVRAFNFNAMSGRGNPLQDPATTNWIEFTNHLQYLQISTGSTVDAYELAIMRAKETLALVAAETD